MQTLIHSTLTPEPGGVIGSEVGELDSEDLNDAAPETEPTLEVTEPARVVAQRSAP